MAARKKNFSYPEEGENKEMLDEVFEERPTLKGTVVDCGSLRVRKKPNFNADIVTEIPAGTELTIVEANIGTGWHRIENDGVTGFVCAQYVSVR